MRLLVGLGLVWTTLILTVVGRYADGRSDGADPSSWPTPNPDPNWYYYDRGPFDSRAYRQVTIAQIVICVYRGGYTRDRNHFPVDTNTGSTDTRPNAARSTDEAGTSARVRR